MKIAYCISGHIREYNSFLSNCSKYFKQLNADIFISTWDTTGINNCFWKGDKEDNDLIDTLKLQELYNPILIDIENRKDYISLFMYDRPLPNSKHNVNILNTLLMFKKIKKCISYTNNKYDLVVRGRFDIESIKFNIDHKLDDNTIYGRLSPINGFPSDIFFYGNYETMIKCIPDESFYTDDILSTSLNAEEIFMKYLKDNNIIFKINDNLNYTLKGINY